MARILLIDDEQEFNRVIGDELRLLGHDVLIATDGRRGLELLRAEHPDAVIVDVVMLLMGGIEFIMEARKTGSDVLIIAISGKDEDDCYLPAAADLGATLTLQKPADPEELDRLIRERAGGKDR